MQAGKSGFWLLDIWRPGERTDLGMTSGDVKIGPTQGFWNHQHGVREAVNCLRKGSDVKRELWKHQRL